MHDALNHVSPPIAREACPARTDVYVVGLGATTPLGQNVDSFWQALFHSPADPRRRAVKGLPNDGRSWTHGYGFADHGSNPTGGPVSRFEQLAQAALAEACADAGLEGKPKGEAKGIPPDLSIGLAIGTAAGDTETAEEIRLTGSLPSFAKCNPYRIVSDLPALSLPIDGPVFSVSNACAAALYALAQACDLIADGTVDAMLVVGVEVLSRVTQASFQRMTALDPDCCRPFEASRSGTVLGEGAAALLLVSPVMAERLPKRPYCRISAFGASCDAHHPTAPQPEGRDIRFAARRALQAAGVGAEQIGIVVPHGTGTPMNDRIEGDMLAETFAGRLEGLHLLPIKAHLGHSAGASGAFSVLVAAKILATGDVPPTLHIETTDPAVPLLFSRDTARLDRQGIQRALVNAYGFGGNNLSVVLEGMPHG